jgi:hypothetical protein
MKSPQGVEKKESVVAENYFLNLIESVYTTKVKFVVSKILKKMKKNYFYYF